jgi:serine/threonine protein kinase
MELVKGFELFDYLNKNGRLPETAAVKIFSQIVGAV